MSSNATAGLLTERLRGLQGDIAFHTSRNESLAKIMETNASSLKQLIDTTAAMKATADTTQAQVQEMDKKLAGLEEKHRTPMPENF